MLKILWKRGEIAPVEQFLLLSIIFCYLMLDFYVKTRIRFSLQDKWLFEIIEVEITRVDYISFSYSSRPFRMVKIQKIFFLRLSKHSVSCSTFDLKHQITANINKEQGLNIGCSVP